MRITQCDRRRVDAGDAASSLDQAKKITTAATTDEQHGGSWLDESLNDIFLPGHQSSGDVSLTTVEPLPGVLNSLLDFRKPERACCEVVEE